MSFSTIVLVIKADRRLKAESNADDYRIRLGLPYHRLLFPVLYSSEYRRIRLGVPQNASGVIAECGWDYRRMRLGLSQNAAGIKVKFYFAPDFVAFNR